MTAELSDHFRFMRPAYRIARPGTLCRPTNVAAVSCQAVSPEFNQSGAPPGLKPSRNICGTPLRKKNFKGRLRSGGLLPSLWPLTRRPSNASRGRTRVTWCGCHEEIPGFCVPSTRERAVLIGCALQIDYTA